MSKIISVHSFRGGTGKSNTSANLSYLSAFRGLRVGVVDTDIQSPGIHVLFGLDDQDMGLSLNDYLWGKCDIEEAAHDVTASLGSDVQGKLFLIPSSIKAGEIARVLREGYDVGLLNDGFHALIQKLKLDLLVIDTHPGLNEETLLSIGISDEMVIILRPDQQDFQGTAVTLDVARSLDVPSIRLFVNKALSKYDSNQIKAHSEQTFEAPVVGVLPLSEDMVDMGSADLFSLRFPDHAWSKELIRAAKSILGLT
jgi:MinD-like ATPase involved in chromosome partitioning or flagellar assembly